MLLRVQTKSGRQVIQGLVESTSLQQLQEVIHDKTRIPPSHQKILMGFPPRVVNGNPSSTLHSLGITNAETLIIEKLDQPVAPVEQRDTTRGKLDQPVAPVEQRDTTRGKLVRKVVPADNSCLFKSISVLLCGGRESSQELRELVSGIVLSDPDKYNTAILGREAGEYVQWLLKSESWGGAIELSVFSDHYKIELDVVDIQTQRVDRFGEGRGYTTRALLLYDGIHYDPLLIDGSPLVTIFPTAEDTVLAEAIEIAAAAHKARQFTDLSGFSLRCLVCGKALRGQTDAQSHAQTTGHINFGEV